MIGQIKIVDFELVLPFKKGEMVYGVKFEEDKSKRMKAILGYIKPNVSALWLDVDFVYRDDQGEERHVDALNMWFSDNEEEALVKYRELIVKNLRTYMEHINDSYSELREIDRALNNLGDEDDDPMSVDEMVRYLENVHIDKYRISSIKELLESNVLIPCSGILRRFIEVDKYWDNTEWTLRQILNQILIMSPP